MNPVRLEKRVAEKNQHRFYRLLLAPTLFGEWSLIREWRRIGHPGTVHVNGYATEAEAVAALSRKIHEKERRGYHCQPIVAEFTVGQGQNGVFSLQQVVPDCPSRDDDGARPTVERHCEPEGLATRGRLACSPRRRGARGSPRARLEPQSPAGDPVAPAGARFQLKNGFAS